MTWTNKFTCAVSDCGKDIYAKGWCRPHWHRMHKYGRLEKIVGLIKGNCTIEGCNEKIKGKGFCKNHYAHFRMYGVHPNEYNQKLKEQNYVCAICEQSEVSVHPISKEIKKLSQDHCHTTSKIRGLLCTRCNHILGRVNEDINLIEKMKQYLLKHNSNGENN
jgi:hypothetical protein